MAPKKVIFTEKAPPPLKGIYNQAIVANGTVYCSGSIALDPNTGELVEGDIGARTVSIVLPDLVNYLAKPSPASSLEEFSNCSGSRWHFDG